MNVNPKPTPIRRLLLGGFLMFASSAVSAHDIYIWPSFFSASMEDTGYIPVDITASHTTFRPDFSMASDGLEVLGVDGKRMRRSGGFYQGVRRSTFDLPVSEQGTYALRYNSGPRYITTYIIGRSDEPKFMMGTKQDVAEKVPAKAKQIKTTAYLSLGMAYVTNNAPTNAVLEPKGEGFELVPVTHPADYVTGEEIVMSLLRDGEPVAGEDAVIELEGPNYRAQPVVFELQSDAQGQISFTPEHGGRYMTKVLSERAVDSDMADAEMTRVYYAFEVIYE